MGILNTLHVAVIVVIIGVVVVIVVVICNPDENHTVLTRTMITSS